MNIPQLVGRNVARLREQRRWSQAELASALGRSDATWTRQKVGMLETRGVRGERLHDLYQLCIALDVGLEELMTADGDEVDLPGGGSVHPSKVVEAICSRGKTSTIQDLGGDPVVTDVAKDDPQEVERVARTIGVSTLELWKAVHKIWQQDSVIGTRDYLAQLEPGMSRAKARAQRGHATRLMKRAILDGSPAEPISDENYRRWSALFPISGTTEWVVQKDQYGER